MNLALKLELEKLNITSCEIRLKGCTNNLFLTPAHRHKRLAYKKKPSMLWNINQVVIACQNCHHYIESKKDLTELIFNKLRGKDDLLS